MISWLKKHFIPHQGNDHRPHFLRSKNIRNVILGVLFIEIFFFLIPTLIHINRSGGMASVAPTILDDLTNKERIANNKESLVVNPVLNKAAEMKANDMAEKGYFAHTSPEGKTPWYWLEKAGYNYQYAGENLAVNFTDSKDVTNAWMNSPSHKSNIIKENYTEMGTGIASGTYEGQPTVFVAQIYANPLPKQTRVINKEAELKSTENTIPKVEQQKEGQNVLGSEVVKETEEVPNVNIARPTLLQKMFASPRNTTNTILFTILGILIISLLLNILIKIKHLHMDLITNGLLVLAVLGAIFVVNYYLSYKDVVITQSINYSNQSK